MGVRSGWSALVGDGAGGGRVVGGGAGGGNVDDARGLLVRISDWREPGPADEAATGAAAAAYGCTGEAVPWT